MSNESGLKAVSRLGATTVAVSVFAVFFGACGGSVSGSSGQSDADFLSACDGSGQCGTLSCQCGVCTRSCERDSDCATLSADAECRERSGCPGATVCVRASAESADASPAGSGGGETTGAGGDPSVTGGGQGGSGSVGQGGAAGQVGPGGSGGGIPAGGFGGQADAGAGEAPDTGVLDATTDTGVVYDAGHRVFGADGGRPLAQCPGDVTPAEIGVRCGSGMLCSVDAPFCCEGEGDVASACVGGEVTWSGKCPEGIDQTAIFCDGPEDCGPAQYCCLGVSQCQDTPCDKDWTVCQSDDDCPSDLPICGAHVDFYMGVMHRVCTKECEQEEDCGDLGDPASCITREGCDRSTCEFSVF